MQPWMTDNEMTILSQSLLNINKATLDILEWGCGGSTVYFTNLLKEKGISYSWTSIEHHDEWFNNIHDQVSKDKNIHLQLVKLSDGECDDTHNPINCDYVNYPLSLNKKFDFILVDGRHREACIKLASQLLKDDGIVVVHDAQRKRYHTSFKYFNTGKFMSYRVWLGSNRKISIFEKARNLLNYYYYRLLVKPLHKTLAKSPD